MAKKQPTKPIWRGKFPEGEQLVDSYEEYVFSWWCWKLFQEGYIVDYKKGNTYSLSDKVTYPYEKKLKTKHKSTEGHLMAAHEYTPDFTILWNEKAKYVFFNPYDVYTKEKSFDFSAPLMADFDNGNWVSVVETKPIFDQNNMTRLAMINIKWVYYRYTVFVNLVKPMPKLKTGLPATTLFKQTFFPPEALVTVIGKKEREIKFKYRLFDDYIEERMKYLESVLPVKENNLLDFL